MSQVVPGNVRLWQLRIFLSLFVGYVLYNVCRQGFVVAAPQIASTYSLRKQDLGDISTAFSIAYGISKFAGGILSDLVSCRMLFALGLLVGAVSNLLFGSSDSTAIFCLCWALNGVGQGVGWPALAQILLRWFEPSRRGLVWSLVTMAGNVGRSVTPMALSSLIIAFGSWRAALLLPGVLSAACSLLFYVLLADSPSEVDVEVEGAPGKQSQQSEQSQQSDRAKRKSNGSAPSTTTPTESFWTLFRVHVAFNVSFWALTWADTFMFFIMRGLGDWLMMYLVEVMGLPTVQCTQVLFWFEIGGICGTVSSGVVSDYLGGKRNLTSAAYCVLLLPSLYIVSTMHSLDSLSLFALSAAVFVCGFALNGPKTMAGIAVRETHKEAGGSASGVLGVVGQVGTAAAGKPLGYIIDTYGWGSMFTLLNASALAGLVLFSLAAVRVDLSSTTQPESKKQR